MLNNYCLILFSADANLLCAEFICGLFGFMFVQLVSLIFWFCM